MILHGGIRPQSVLRGSWQFLLGVTAWNLVIVYLDEVLQFHFIAHPTPPVTTLGVAVSFYLGFKNTSAFGRWWEARKLWGEIVNGSRDWGNAVANLMTSDGPEIDPVVRRLLVERHIAWLNMLAFQLRATSPLGRKRRRWRFGHMPVTGQTDLHQTPDSWQRHIPPEDAEALDGKANRAALLLFRQGTTLRGLAEAGSLDSIRHAAMMDRLRAFADAQGKCERIKNTPFPRQIADIGEIFTWLFITMLPLAFVDLYSAPEELEGWARWAFVDYTAAMVPFSVLVCWVFFVTEKVSASMEDPFDGEVTDVPISAICRTIEIDLRQMTGFGEPPPPLAPIDAVLY